MTRSGYDPHPESRTSAERANRSVIIVCAWQPRRRRRNAGYSLVGSQALRRQVSSVQFRGFGPPTPVLHRECPYKHFGGHGPTHCVPARHRFRYVMAQP